MANYTLRRPDVFPAGVTVSAYLKVTPQLPDPWAGPPPGAVVSSAVATGTDVTFSGLTAGDAYLAYAASPDRYIGFTVDAVSSGGGGGGDVGLSVYELDLSSPGSLETGAGTARKRIMTDPGAEIVEAVATLGTPSAAQAVIVNIRRDGLSVFGDPADRLTIPAGAGESSVVVPDRGGFAEGNILTVDIDQVGSGTTGSDLTVTLVMSPLDAAPDPLEAASFYELATTYPGIKAFWGLDEPSGTAMADSFSSVDGNYAGSPLPTLAKTPLVVGGTHAVGFARASSQRVEISNDPGFAGLGAMSLSAHVKPASQPTAGQFFTIASKSQTGESATWAIDYRNIGGVLQVVPAVRCDTDPTTEHTVVQTLATGSTYHIVMVWDGALMHLYVNGAEVGTPTARTGTMVSTAAGMTIGCYDYLSPSDFFNGDIDDVVFWSQALSGGQVAALHTKGLTG